MSKQTKKPAVRSTMECVIFEMSVNGVSGTSVNYRRVEHEDGSIEETGRPPGMAAGLSLGDALHQAFAASAPPSTKKGSARGKAKRES
jgi:hypothetical protein